MTAAFDYHRPASVDEALSLIQQNEDAKLLAGGHSLLPAMKLRLSTPGALVDIGRLEELQYIRDGGDHIALGAGTTHHAIESSDLMAEKAPLLAQTAAVIGDPQVRNKGTIGGSLAHADPAADYPAAILATEAQIVVRGSDGERVIDAADYFIDLFLTSLGPDEIITEVRVPVQGANTGSCYLKFHNPASRFAVVGVAAQVTVENGTCSRVRIGITGAANAAFRDSGVERALQGQAASADTIAAAAANAAQGQELLGDTFAGEDYRRHLCRVYTGRALTQASGG
ncbi:MAG: xanthine dehydrogenase family protein subunit M [Candidatus Latescibacteria bacterium]|nr:xanthine dehydrogenase family protein subunit M [Candidatus Latescibacterota bacterium]